MIHSVNVELILLIVILYGMTTSALLYVNEGLVNYSYSGASIILPRDGIRIAGRVPILINPLTPMFPVFRARWGVRDIGMSERDIRKQMKRMIVASKRLAPYSATIFVYVVVGIPIGLILNNTLNLILIVAVAYTANIMMLVRLWFMRNCFLLTKAKFAAIAFESLVCLPFSAGIVRRLTLSANINTDITSLFHDMDNRDRKIAINALCERCNDLKYYYAEGSSEAQSLQRYTQDIQSSYDEGLSAK